MTRVVGIDPGTVSIDVSGIMDRQLYLDRSWPTAEARSEPDRLRIREARGTVLDHLIFVSPAAARRRLGVEAGG
jgi:predicted butyrate kinase (DUF1464 family)